MHSTISVQLVEILLYLCLCIDIPFSKMWPDDPYWMPLLLSGKKFMGRFEYSDDDTIEEYSLKEQ